MEPINSGSRGVFITLEQAGFPREISRILVRAGYRTLADLEKTNAVELLKLRGISFWRLDKITFCMRCHGMDIGTYKGAK